MSAFVFSCSKKIMKIHLTRPPTPTTTTTSPFPSTNPSSFGNNINRRVSSEEMIGLDR
jgi:hypothetical protein